MKTPCFCGPFLLVLSWTLTASATVRYVDINSSQHTSPYTNRTAAAATIQDAIDVADAGDLILVNSGVYQTGGRVVYGGLTNRVALTKPVTVESANGPDATIIEGYQAPGTVNGDTAVRCAYLTNGAVLTGFTLQDGATLASGDLLSERSGAGVWCESTNAVVSNCLIIGNSADYAAGGVYGGTVSECSFEGNTADYGGGAAFAVLNWCTLTSNEAETYGGGAGSSTLNWCTLKGNSAGNGGGASGGTLNNCVLVRNSASTNGGGAGFAAVSGACQLNNCSLVGNSAGVSGGGIFQATARNCIVYYNFAPADSNYSGGDVAWSCTTPLPASGAGNITNAPLFVDLINADLHLKLHSPTIDAGNNADAASDTDLDGSPRIFGGTVDMGAYEFHFTLRYVDVNSLNPTPPYTDWDTAAATIQDAIDAADSWDIVLVTNGVYRTGGRAVSGQDTLTNRAALTKPLTMRSVNGPAVTLIEGNQVPETITGDEAVRCVYLADGAELSGFTLTNGATLGGTHNNPDLFYGGGAWCESTMAVLSNCVLVANAADWGSGLGGGVFSGTLQNCTLSGNSAQTGGGAANSVLAGCTLSYNWASYLGGATYQGSATQCLLSGNTAYYGGGAGGTTLSNSTLADNSAVDGGGAAWGGMGDCTLTGNSASDSGGAAYSAYVNNCLVVSNSAAGSGGGACSCTVNACTLSANRAWDGGGASDGSLNNCILSGNRASSLGGGAYSSSLNNCAVFDNLANQNGGGVCGGTLSNCTVVGNSAALGGGASSSTLDNCIVYYNQAPAGANYSGGLLNYCCTAPLPSAGAGNLSAEPLLADAFHLSTGSPCRGAGSAAYAAGLDIDGEPWASPPSVGCDEYSSGALTGPLSVAIQTDTTNLYQRAAAGFTARITGRATANYWEFGDGTVVSNQPYVSHSWAARGDYEVIVHVFNDAFTNGVSAALTVHVMDLPVYYVAAGNPNPVAPYLSWATAATNLQDAVDVAIPGTRIVVSNGVYQFGGRVVYGALTNRVAVTKPLALQSVNGPAVTAIQGFQPTAPTNEANAVRCVYLTNGASLSGFTLTQGGTRSLADSESQMSGGGAWCESTQAVLSNCVLSGNAAYRLAAGVYSGTLNSCVLLSNLNFGSVVGGGAYYSTLNNCTVRGNSATHAGGAFHSTLNNCTVRGNTAAYVGGGAYYSTLNNCTVSGNSASDGGGASSSTLNNCLITSNSASGYVCTAGGTSSSTLNNCTVVGNRAFSIYVSGGVFSGSLSNCIVYYNTAPNSSNYQGCAAQSCCTVPLAAGPGNITNAPLFVDLLRGNLRLETNSPCINAGANAYTVGGADLDGRPRIIGGTVDMGAYEFQGPDIAPLTAWLQQYGLPTDGSADYADSDGDGMNNWQEWRCGTDPTNALSLLRLLSPSIDSSGITITWQSVPARTYFLQRSTNLQSQAGFLPLASNLPGQAGTTSFTDTNAVGDGPFYYRVGVEE